MGDATGTKHEGCEESHEPLPVRGKRVGLFRAVVAAAVLSAGMLVVEVHDLVVEFREARAYAREVQPGQWNSTEARREYVRRVLHSDRLWRMRQQRVSWLWREPPPEIDLGGRGWAVELFPEGHLGRTAFQPRLWTPGIMWAFDPEAVQEQVSLGGVTLVCTLLALFLRRRLRPQAPAADATAPRY